MKFHRAVTIYFVCFEAGSHVSQAGLKFIMYWRMTVNF